MATPSASASSALLPFLITACLHTAAHQAAAAQNKDGRSEETPDFSSVSVGHQPNHLPPCNGLGAQGSKNSSSCHHPTPVPPSQDGAVGVGTGINP